MPSSDYVGSEEECTVSLEDGGGRGNRETASPSGWRLVESAGAGGGGSTGSPASTAAKPTITPDTSIVNNP